MPTSKGDKFKLGHYPLVWSVSPRDLDIVEMSEQTGSVCLRRFRLEDIRLLEERQYLPTSRSVDSEEQ